MPAQQKARAKGRKIGRNKKHQAAVYLATRRMEKNAKRRLRRHVRSNPGDASAARTYAKTFGPVEPLGLSGRGQKLQRRIEKLTRMATLIGSITIDEHL